MKYLHIFRTGPVALMLVSALLQAQTTLPKVDVTAPPWQERHGGYLISSNFKVDTHMSAVIYPARPFHKGDILSVRLNQMKDDEYFILQECISNPCVKARILRAWNAYGALGRVPAHAEDRVWIPHEGKFFMWMQRIPMSGRAGPFTGYDPVSPPMVFNPTGSQVQFQDSNVEAAQRRGPETVVSSTHDGMSYAIKFDSGTSVLIKRMHAVR